MALCDSGPAWATRCAEGFERRGFAINLAKRMELALRDGERLSGLVRLAAALFYSLIESAKLCGVEPRAYLQEAIQRAVRNPGTFTLARGLKSQEA